MIKISRCSRG